MENNRTVDKMNSEANKKVVKHGSQHCRTKRILTVVVISQEIWIVFGSNYPDH